MWSGGSIPGSIPGLIADLWSPTHREQTSTWTRLLESQTRQSLVFKPPSIHSKYSGGSVMLWVSITARRTGAFLKVCEPMEEDDVLIDWHFVSVGCLSFNSCFQK